ncbi:energy-coupling factor transporter transmembrane component T [Luteococcus peritonei]|uniref:Energy-coupling factor transporter transmembrane component T family protein n=1 Tax=Luteococcus peritonei TaxID=88874 RepID=A0ABW4RXU8_9ACTN
MRSTLGLYRPGSSPLHRLGAGPKLVALLVLGLASVLLQRSLVATLGSLAVVLVLYAVAGMDLRTTWQQVRPMAWLLLFTAAFHLWASGWRKALVYTAMIVVMVLAAALVTLTTRTTAMVDQVVRAAGPLRRLGVDPERVGLVLNLGIRCVPLVAAIAAEVREAQYARLGQFSLRSFAVPLVVRCLRDADALGEALAARGVDD